MPPSTVGSDHEIVAVVSPPVPDTAVGALAVVIGVAPAEPDASPAPAALMALTRNAYAVPFVRPFTTTFVPELPVLAIETVHVAPASLERSTLYPDTGEPLVFSGAVHDSNTDALAPVATSAVGAAGTV